MTTLARIKTAGRVVLWQYLGFIPIAALLALLCMLHVGRLAAAIWFALILIPPYLGALAARPAWPSRPAVHPAALALGSAGGCVLGLWAGQDLADDAWVIFFEIVCSLGGAFLMTFWSAPARRSNSRAEAAWGSPWSVVHGVPARLRSSSWGLPAGRGSSGHHAERWGI